MPVYKYILALIIATIYYVVVFIQGRGAARESKMGELIRSMQGDDKHIDELEKKLKRTFYDTTFSRDELEAIHRCLTCESCGAPLKPSKVKAEDSFIQIQCRYCNTLYILKRNK